MFPTSEETKSFIPKILVNKSRNDESNRTTDWEIGSGRVSIQMDTESRALHPLCSAYIAFGFVDMKLRLTT